MRAVVALLMLTVPAGVTAQLATSVQEVLLRAKPAVAIVISEVAAEVTATCRPGEVRKVTVPPVRESGTGWVVNPSGWLLTSARVVAAVHTMPRWLSRQQAEAGVRAACVPALLEARGLAPGQRPDVEEQLARDLMVSILPGARVELAPSISVILSNGVRVPATVAKYSPPVVGEAMAGRDLALLRLEAADLPTLRLADSAKAKIGDRLHVIGYPGVVMTRELLNASTTVEASVTTGAISGFNQDVNNQPLIQTDAAAAVGASGSPAVDSTGAVLGMLSFVTSDEGTVVQGFNFVLPASAVREFMRGTGVGLDEPSRFNAVWHAGLAEYFAGRHARAGRHLREANRLMPELPDVRRISVENAERAKAEPWLPWRSVGIAMLAIAAAGWAWIWGRARARNRFRLTPLEVATLIDAPTQPPIILDARDADTYAKSPMRIPRSIHLPLDRLSEDQPLPIDTARSVVAYCT